MERGRAQRRSPRPIAGRDWATHLAAGIGRRVADLRTEQKITAKQLADRCAELGFPLLSRIVITKLENGRREGVSVAELLVLAKALGVPGIELIFPVGHVKDMEVIPGPRSDPWEALRSFTGEDVPVTIPFFSDLGAIAPGETTVNVFRRHNMIMEALQMAKRALDDNLERAGDLLDDEQRKQFLDAARKAADELSAQTGPLVRLRRALTERGLVPPALPPDLSHLDGGDPDGAH